MSTSIVIAFITIVVLLPALVAYFIAKKNIKFGWLLVMIMPFMFIFFYAELFQFLTPPQERPMSYDAPMDGVIYVIYGVPSAFISLVIWNAFKVKK